MGSGDVFELVVVFEIDLMQAVGFRRTTLEIGPAGERRARRPAIGAAGEAAELVGLGLLSNWSADLEVPNGGAAQRLGSGWGCNPIHHANDQEEEIPACHNNLRERKSLFLFYSGFLSWIGIPVRQAV